jgi:hypothetical protein
MTLEEYQYDRQRWEDVYYLHEVSYEELEDKLKELEQAVEGIY